MKGPLPFAWEQAVSGWVRWLTIAGKLKPTIRTRRGHVRAVARLSQTRHPSDVNLDLLVVLFSDRKYSLEHRRAARTSLIQFFDWCVENKVCECNPAAGLPRVPEDSPRPKPAPEWLWNDLMDVAPPRELLMIRLAGEAGLRRQEICQVHRDDVLWDGQGYALRVLGKGGKQRVVPINDRLAEQIQRGPGEWVPEGCDNGYLFPSFDKWGNLIAPHLSADRVGRLVSDLMGPGWSAHKLRHRYATKGYAGTRNLRAVQVALGHASVATTQRYTACTEPEVRSVAEAVVTIR
jgi:integrase